MSRWLVQIEGEKFDVEEFPYWFPDGEAHVIVEDGRFLLTGKMLERFDEPYQVYQAAEQLIDEWFGIIALLQSNLKKPTIGMVFCEDSDGHRRGSVFASGSISARSKVRARLTLVGRKGEDRGPTQAQKLLVASRSNRRLQVAVSIIAIPGATWPHLYRCLEEIEGFLEKTVSSAGFCSKNQRERFTRTANSAEVSGTDSRHGAGKFAPPKDPMTLSEAKSFISQIVQATLGAVAKNRSGDGNQDLSQSR